MRNFHTLSKLIAIGLIWLFARVTSAQQAPFASLASRSVTISKDTLEELESHQSKINISGTALLIPDSVASFVIRTGPEDDMLSYRIQGLRNPSIVVRAGTVLHVLFVNVDDDMFHDIRFGGEPPDTSGSAGTMELPHASEESYFSEAIQIRAMSPGRYPYFCSVGDHAANGMRGSIIVVHARATMNEMVKAASMAGMDKTEQMEMNAMNMEAGASSMKNMDMSGLLLTEPMAQEGSGTSWVPASTPEYMSMHQVDDWTLMLHGAIFPRYDYQSGPRGGHRIDAPDWGMAMLEHAVGMNGLFTAHLMMSLDPLTIGGQGYPLLLQTGETWHGVKLHDVQHPHDLFDEVSATYSQKLADNSSAYLYLGYPGEPALGPPVFMHRSSAMSNPNAPIGHHWMDATHITFGVVTAGVSVGNWKLEGSYFNGSEPDENRYDFDSLKLNSYSGRLSFNPTKDLALQVSSGLIKNPEGDGVNVVRTTASAMYTKQYANENWWSTAAAWGQNHEVNGLTMNALLIESQYDWKCWSIYGRGEYVQKSNAELVIAGIVNPLVSIAETAPDPNKINDVEEITAGVTRKLFSFVSLDVDLGVQGILDFVPPSLIPYYNNHPAAYEVYFSIHPSFGGMNM